jgi:peptidyl-dipeptidase Dcp
MKKTFQLILVVVIFSTACQNDKTTDQVTGENPFFQKWETPFGVPPFNQIKTEHYLPAFKEGMAKQADEINEIINNTEAATFENTLVAFDESGYLLKTVSSVFFNLTEALTNEAMQNTAKEVAPLLSKHTDEKYLNEKLFARIKEVYSQKDDLDLDAEQMMLLEKTYKKFVRGGANLVDDKKERFSEINGDLSLLTLQFGENLLSETNGFKLVIENEADLAGLSENIKNAAAETAESLGETGKWVFTLHKPSMIPFLQYADKRDLREKIYKAYLNRGNNNNEFDNKEIINKIVALRLERANLLGFETHANFILDNNMAKKPDEVYNLLNQLIEKSMPMAKKEAKMMQEMIDKDGGDYKLESWDWWYLAEKIKKEKYDVDENEIRNYFKLENVRDGIFGLLNDLFGLKVIIRNDIPTYHADVQAFEVKDADDKHIGILFMDFYPRESKRGGAWMDTYRKQTTINGEFISPIVPTVYNFTKPTGDTPALLSIDEASTMFHEIGHAIHGLLSQCKYYSLSGTSVSRDFVELPSQILENWVMEPEMLAKYAFHYETGEVIPMELINKLKAAGNFNQGFALAEYLAASTLDMNYHTIKEKSEIDVEKFEKESMEKIGLIDEIAPRYRSTYFAHIFSGGYSAGYYSYMWAEVLDADAYEAFKESGDIFNKEVAASFRTNILEKGGTVEPMTLYKQYRGSEPKIEPLLKRKGIF